MNYLLFIGYLLLWYIPGLIATIILFKMKVPDTRREQMKAINFLCTTAIFGHIVVYIAAIDAIERRGRRIKAEEDRLIADAKANEALDVRQKQWLEDQKK